MGGRSTLAELEFEVARVIVATTGISAISDVLDATIDTLGLDSLAVVDLVFTIEDALETELAEDALSLLTGGASIRAVLMAAFTLHH